MPQKVQAICSVIEYGEQLIADDDCGGMHWVDGGVFSAHHDQ